MNERTLLNNVMTLQTNHCLEKLYLHVLLQCEQVCYKTPPHTHGQLQCESTNRVSKLLILGANELVPRGQLQRAFESDIELTTTPKHVLEGYILKNFMYTMGTFRVSSP